MTDKPIVTIGDYLETEKWKKAQANELLVADLSRQIHTGCITKYKTKFIETMLQHIGIDGKSYASLAFKLGVADRATLYSWEKKHPEWKAAKKIAQSGRLNHVEGMLQDLACGNTKGNAAAAIFYAKNACPDEFKDKRELEVSGGVTYIIDTGIPARVLDHIDENEEEFIEAEFQEIESDEDLL